MKRAKALDISGDGQIEEGEFKRLYNPSVLAAAKAAVHKERLEAKVDQMWTAMPTDASGQIERLACWDLIFADAELAGLIGESDAADGTRSGNEGRQMIFHPIKFDPPPFVRWSELF